MIKAIVVVLSRLYSGFVVLMLWNWFFATALHMPVLSLLQAIGVDIAASYIVTTDIWSIAKLLKNVDFDEMVITGTVYSTMTLLSGWIVHLLLVHLR